MINVASVSVVDKTNVIRAIITGSDRVANKVAARWLFANMVLEYDWLIRLQVLEGTAGVPQGTWWNKRERGLRMARRFLKGDNDTESGEGKDINELWFTRENTGMFQIIKQIVTSEIKKSPYIRGGDPMGFINSALMGLSVDVTSDYIRSLPAYGAGKILKSGILRGSETPETVAKGNLSRMIKQRVMDESKTVVKLKQMPTDEEGNVKDLRDVDKDDVPAWQVLSALFFDEDDNSQLSRKLKNLMKEVFSSSVPMTAWLDKIQITGESPQLSDVAESVGIAKQTFGSRHWKPTWEKLFRAIFSNHDLMDEVLDRVKSDGADIDDLNVDEFLDKMEKPHRVASIMLLSNSIRSFPDYMFRLQGRRIH